MTRITKPTDAAFAADFAENNFGQEGLTKQEFFAGLAMIGIIAHHGSAAFGDDSPRDAEIVEAATELGAMLCGAVTEWHKMPEPEVKADSDRPEPEVDIFKTLTPQDLAEYDRDDLRRMQQRIFDRIQEILRKGGAAQDIVDYLGVWDQKRGQMFKGDEAVGLPGVEIWFDYEGGIYVRDNSRYIYSELDSGPYVTPGPIWTEIVALHRRALEEKQRSTEKQIAAEREELIKGLTVGQDWK